MRESKKRERERKRKKEREREREREAEYESNKNVIIHSLCCEIVSAGSILQMHFGHVDLLFNEECSKSNK